MIHSQISTSQHQTQGFPDSAHSLMNDTTLFISHELRNPLTSIHGVLKLLHTGQFGSLSEEGQQLLTIALNNTNRLSRLASAIEREAVAPITLLSPDEIEQFQLENEMYQALAHQQFQLDYQPIMEAKSEQIVSFEALLRWNHPTRGNIPPAVFIPIAEKIGLIQKLGAWVIEQACQQLANWQQQFSDLSCLSISINLSALQLLQPDLLQQVQQILQETGIEPKNLKLEVTETALIENLELAFSVLSQFREMGIQVYVDDFGTGYSSLARLQELPIDALKIDRSFIQLKCWDISETIIALASRLGLAVIAEGVETPEELMALKTLGCQHMQGYFFSKPVDLTTATRLLADYLNSKENNP